eukprot:2758551-Amphidinium_carterae.1
MDNHRTILLLSIRVLPAHNFGNSTETAGRQANVALRLSEFSSTAYGVIAGQLALGITQEFRKRNCMHSFKGLLRLYWEGARPPKSKSCRATSACVNTFVEVFYDKLTCYPPQLPESSPERFLVPGIFSSFLERFRLS